MNTTRWVPRVARIGFAASTARRRTSTACHGLWLLMLLIGPACDRHDARPNPTDDVIGTAHSGNAPRLRYSRLPLPPTHAPPPPGYATATALWQTATTSFARRAYRQAAGEFLDCAEALKPTDSSRDHQRLLTAARCVAYENATHASYLSAAPSALSRRIDSALDSDRACAHSIEAAKERHLRQKN